MHNYAKIKTNILSTITQSSVSSSSITVEKSIDSDN